MNLEFVELGYVELEALLKMRSDTFLTVQVFVGSRLGNILHENVLVGFCISVTAQRGLSSAFDNDLNTSDLHTSKFVCVVFLTPEMHLQE